MKKAILLTGLLFVINSEVYGFFKDENQLKKGEISSFSLYGKMKYAVSSCNSNPDKFIEIENKNPKKIIDKISFTYKKGDCLYFELYPLDNRLYYTDIRINNEITIYGIDITKDKINNYIEKGYFKFEAENKDFDYRICDKLEYYTGETRKKLEEETCKDYLAIKNKKFENKLVSIKLPFEGEKTPFYDIQGFTKINTKDGSYNIISNGYKGNFYHRNEEGNTLNVLFYEPGKMNGETAGKNWTYSIGIDRNKDVVKFTDDEEKLKIYVNMHDKSVFTLMSEYNGLVYYWDGMIWNSLVPNKYYYYSIKEEEFEFEKPNDSGLKKALSAGKYNLSLHFNNKRHYSHEIDIDSNYKVSSVNLPDEYEYKTNILNDEDIVKGYLRIEEFSRSIATLGSDCRAVYPDFFGKKGVIRRYLSDTIQRLLFVVGVECSDNKTLEEYPDPYVVLTGGGGEVTKRLDKKIQYTKNLKFYWNTVDVQAENKVYDYTFYVGGVEGRKSNLELNTNKTLVRSEVVNFVKDKGFLNIQVSFTGSPNIEGYVFLSERDGKSEKYGEIRKIVGMNGLYNLEIPYYLVGVDNKKLGVDIVLYDAEGVILPMYPSGTGYEYNISSVPNRMVSGDLRVNFNGRELVIDTIINADRNYDSGLKGKVDVYLLLIKDSPYGSRGLYVIADGYGVSDSKVPLYSYTTDKAIFERKSIREVIDLSEFFGFRFKGNYKVIMSIEVDGKEAYRKIRYFVI